jgi:glycosyltransferase involved in cell wall biosynthesis
MNPLNVSIAMATYNGERYLEEQLISLAAQTVLPFELVVCDDGSVDSTLSILQRFKREAPFPVRIMKNSKRLGYQDNFLRCASLCEGDLIAFCDQDDVWLENKLERVLTEFDVRPDIMLVVHSAEVVDHQLQPIGYQQPRISHAVLRQKLQNPPWWVPPGFSMIFRAELIRDIPWWDRPHDYHAPQNSLAHDKWIYFLANAVGATRYITDVLALYRQHGQNTCGSSSTNVRRALSQALTAGEQRYRLVSEIAQEYMEHLLRIRDQCPRRYYEDLTRASQLYARLADTFARRTLLYDKDIKQTQRIRLLSQSVFKGSYRGHIKAGLGVRALAKDLVALVAPRLFLRG